MATKSSAEKKLLIIEKGKVIKITTPQKIQRMTPDELMTLRDKKIIETTGKQIEVVYTVNVKRVNWDGKISK